MINNNGSKKNVMRTNKIGTSFERVVKKAIFSARNIGTFRMGQIISIPLRLNNVCANAVCTAKMGLFLRATWAIFSAKMAILVQRQKNAHGSSM